MGWVVVGAEVVVGYLFAWVMRKARRAGDRADRRVDAALDLGVDRLGDKLHELVVGKPGAAAALEQLASEAQQGLEAPSPVTAQWLAAVLQNAAERDSAFAEAVDALIEQLHAVQSGTGGMQARGGVAVAGRMDVKAEGGSVAGGVIHGGVRLNPPPPDPSMR